MHVPPFFFFFVFSVVRGEGGSRTSRDIREGETAKTTLSARRFIEPPLQRMKDVGDDDDESRRSDENPDKPGQ